MLLTAFMPALCFCAIFLTNHGNCLSPGTIQSGKVTTHKQNVFPFLLVFFLLKLAPQTHKKLMMVQPKMWSSQSLGGKYIDS